MCRSIVKMLGRSPLVKRQGRSQIYSSASRRTYKVGYNLDYKWSHEVIHYGRSSGREGLSWVRWMSWIHLVPRRISSNSSNYTRWNGAINTLGLALFQSDQQPQLRQLAVCMMHGQLYAFVRKRTMHNPSYFWVFSDHMMIEYVRRASSVQCWFGSWKGRVKRVIQQLNEIA